MSPQGRPRKFDEGQVLCAARDVFWEYGFEAASLAQLRAATGLSSASLYGAFGSKVELFERAIEHYVDGPGRVTDIAADTSLTAAEALSSMLSASINMQSDPTHPMGCLITLSATIGATSGEACVAYAAASRRRGADRRRIADCVRRGQRDGQFSNEVDADTLGSLIYTFLSGISTQLRDGVSSEQLHDAADVLMSRVRLAG